MRLLSILVLAVLCHLSIAQPAATDCVQSEWGPWDTTCSKTCNGGVLRRERTTITPASSPNFVFKTGICKCDMVLLLDASYSLSADDVQGLATFAAAYVAQLTTTKLAILLYDDTVTNLTNGLTSDKDALTAALAAAPAAYCDGVVRNDCIGKRNTYAALAKARDVFEAELEASPKRYACRVILTVTHGPPTDVAGTIVSDLQHAHPDWGMMLAAVGPNAFLQSVQPLASSAQEITLASSYADLFTQAPQLLDQCSSFGKSGSSAAPCNCDYLVVSDLSYGPKVGSLTWNGNYRTIQKFISRLVRKTVDNRFAFIGFDANFTTPLNDPAVVYDDSVRYFFDNTDANEGRIFNWELTAPQYPNTTDGSAIAQLNPCVQSASPICQTRRTLDALAEAERIFDTSGEASRAVCKIVLLVLSNDYDRAHLSDANKNIIQKIKGHHPDWAIAVVGAVMNETVKKSYYSWATTPLNVFTSTTYGPFVNETMADEVLKICPDIDQPGLLPPIPCGPEKDLQICNADATCDIDCVLGDPVVAIPCSKTCGGGVQTMKRELISESSGNGKPCNFSEAVYQEACNEVPCPTCKSVLGSCAVGTNFINEAQLCAGSAAECQTLCCAVVTNCDASWSAWTPCSKSCDGGVQTRVYTIVTQPALGGIPCEADDGATASQACGTELCGCRAHWAPGKCSVFCGGDGILTSTLTLNEGVAPGQEGSQCEAPIGAKRTAVCNRGKCPVCGDGFIDWNMAEQCEPPNKKCCSANCTFLAAGTVCRKAIGECDSTDTCSGLDGKCTLNGLRADGMPCHLKGLAKGDHFICKAGRCVPRAFCGNGKVEPGEECEPVQGVVINSCCDDKCKFKNTTVLCRAIDDTACDVAEYCTGHKAECPPDRHQPEGKICIHPLTKSLQRCRNGFCVPQHSSFSTTSYGHHHN